MRKIQNTQSRVIGFQNGQDASLVTLKQQARAQSVPIPIPVATNFSKIGGSVGNIVAAPQQTDTPKGQKTSLEVTANKVGPPTINTVTLAGYRGVASGIASADTTGNLIGAAQYCAVSSDARSSAPYSVVIPCGIFIDPVSYNPNPNTRIPGMAIDPTTHVQTAVNSPVWVNPPTQDTAGNAPGKSQFYGAGNVPPQNLSNNDYINRAALDAERVSVEGKQAALRTRYNLPAKLNSHRGTVYN